MDHDSQANKNKGSERTTWHAGQGTSWTSAGGGHTCLKLYTVDLPGGLQAGLNDPLLPFREMMLWQLGSWRRDRTASRYPTNIEKMLLRLMNGVLGAEETAPALTEHTSHLNVEAIGF